VHSRHLIIRVRSLASGAACPGSPSLSEGQFVIISDALFGAQQAADPLQGRLDGRTAVVTGAGRGIGLAIVERFLSEGASVVMTQRSASEGEAICARLQAGFPDRIAFVAADIRSPAEVERVTSTALERFGAIDVLCNNAGRGLVRTVHETSQDEYDLVMDTNVRGVFLACGAAIPHMLRQGRGSVVNIASVAAWVGFESDAAYCASKGAVVSLTRQMALDYATKGIRVNCVCPGFVDTEMMRVFVESHADPSAVQDEIVGMHPMGRVGEPAEVAAAAAFLASDDASFITGESLAVDGGLLAR
jgi:2-keto-3-deoxy-L-fuconate dehydrogenase